MRSFFVSFVRLPSVRNAVGIVADDRPLSPTTPKYGTGEESQEMPCIRCHTHPTDRYGLWQDCRSGLWKSAHRPNSGTLCRACAIAAVKRLNHEARAVQRTLHGEVRRWQIDSEERTRLRTHL